MISVASSTSGIPWIAVFLIFSFYIIFKGYFPFIVLTCMNFLNAFTKMGWSSLSCPSHRTHDSSGPCMWSQISLALS